jgi:hypothetical protein
MRLSQTGHNIVWCAWMLTLTICAQDVVCTGRRHSREWIIALSTTCKTCRTSTADQVALLVIRVVAIPGARRATSVRCASETSAVAGSAKAQEPKETLAARTTPSEEETLSPTI